MDFKIYKDTAAAAECICDTKTELPVETEILIPDYLQPVFKIVKCFVRLIVLQKQVVSGRLSAEGYLQCTVLYQTQENESLCQAEQKIPFTKQMDTKPGSWGPAIIEITGETEYVNCRAVNPRRIDIRGAFAVSVSAYAEAQNEIITAVQGTGIEQKIKTLSGIRMIGSHEKVITAEEQIEFRKVPETIILTQCSGKVTETKLIAGKAVLKGEIAVHVLYRAEPGYDLIREEYSIPFNEVIDAEGADENCRCFALAESAGCTITAEKDENSAQISVTAVLYARVYRTAEYLAVSDVFSTRNETETVLQQVMIEKEEDIFSLETEAVAAGRLPDENVQIIHALATPSPVEIIGQEGETVLRGRVTAHLLCINALGEIDCYDKVCEYTLPKHYPYPPSEMTIQCRVTIRSVSVHSSGNETNAAVSLEVCGMITRRASEEVLGDVKCMDPLNREDDGVALRIYYAQEGEELFEIAKRYTVSPALVASANDLQDDFLQEPKRLLIPSAV